MQIETLNIELLIPYAKNSRTHSPEQVAQIAGSIREFGFTNPVLVDEQNGIIAGHGRVMAARKLNMPDVPCIRLAGLTETQKRAYVIADNKLALNAGWDDELLALELKELENAGFDLELTGFSDEEIAALLMVEESQEGLTDEDEVPEPPADPVTKLGDVWVMGDHRLVCGDSTSIDAVELLMAGQYYDILIFDPPYEVEELYKLAMLPSEPEKKLIIFWDFKRFAVASYAALNAGWIPQYELIWDNVTSWYTPNRPLARHKSAGVFGNDPKWNFDAAIIRDGKRREAKTVKNSRGSCNYKPLDGAVHLRTIESFPTTQESSEHAHSKPIAWIEAIFNGVGGLIYLDLFGGSGSTLIACQKTGRKARLMEIDPRYCDVIIKRWQDFTGKNAVLESTGELFSDLENDHD